MIALNVRRLISEAATHWRNYDFLKKRRLQKVDDTHVTNTSFILISENTNSVQQEVIMMDAGRSVNKQKNIALIYVSIWVFYMKAFQETCAKFNISDLLSSPSICLHKIKKTTHGQHRPQGVPTSEVHKQRKGNANYRRCTKHYLLFVYILCVRGAVKTFTMFLFKN